MRVTGSVRSWLSVGFPSLTLAGCLALAGAGCAGRYGAMRFDARVAQDLCAAQVLSGHRYYTTGSELDPAAIVALREERPLRGAWREIAATPALLAKLCSEMRGTRLNLPDGAVILDDRGERIGVWYSYLAFPPPPKLLDDGSVELATPFVPQGDGDDSGKLRD